jgi:hypothetical protein
VREKAVEGRKRKSCLRERFWRGSLIGWLNPLKPNRAKPSASRVRVAKFRHGNAGIARGTGPNSEERILSPLFGIRHHPCDL